MSETVQLLPIVQVGDPVLRRPAGSLTRKEIRSPAIQHLVETMRETMRSSPGVGLAAPQIGQSIQLAVIEDREDYHRDLAPEALAARERTPIPFHVIFNPRIISASSDAATFYEGCLSLTGFSAQVRRSLAVRVECLDEHGNPRVIDARGWYARILQHEIDHLLGYLYIDRMDIRTFTTRDNHLRYCNDAAPNPASVSS